MKDHTPRSRVTVHHKAPQGVDSHRTLSVVDPRLASVLRALAPLAPLPVQPTAVGPTAARVRELQGRIPQ